MAEREKMRKFLQPERKQLLLLTNVRLETVAPVGSTVKIIDEMVDRLDTSTIEETYNPLCVNIDEAKKLTLRREKNEVQFGVSGKYFEKSIAA